MAHTGFPRPCNVGMLWGPTKNHTPTKSSQPPKGTFWSLAGPRPYTITKLFQICWLARGFEELGSLEPGLGV